MTEPRISKQDQARLELEQLPLNSEIMDALQDPAHPGHKAATTRRRMLYEAVSGQSNGPRSTDDGTGSRGEIRSADDADGDRNFWQMPEDPESYRFDPVPVGVQHDIGLERKARGWFHQAGVPQWLARNVVREWNRSIGSPPDNDQVEASAAATEKALRRSWGETYEAKVDAARSIVGGLKDEAIADLLDQSGLTNNEYLIRQLVALAEKRDGDDA